MISWVLSPGLPQVLLAGAVLVLAAVLAGRVVAEAGAGGTAVAAAVAGTVGEGQEGNFLEGVAAVGEGGAVHVTTLSL